MITSTCITKYYAALDRIDFTRLSDDKPIRKMTDLPIFIILPGVDDCLQMRQNFAMIVGLWLNEIGQ